MTDLEKIATVCHEANRRYCFEIGDASHKSWEETPWSTKQTAIAGVAFLVENPEAPLRFVHEKWRQNKLSDGWRYGATVDEDAKTHPFMLVYEELPPEQKVKDRLFRAVVKSLTEGEINV